ncbi:unnamed protein product, partial [Sphacelaria rigidula]
MHILLAALASSCLLRPGFALVGLTTRSSKQHHNNPRNNSNGGGSRSSNTSHKVHGLPLLRRGGVGIGIDIDGSGASRRIHAVSGCGFCLHAALASSISSNRRTKQRRTPTPSVAATSSRPIAPPSPQLFRRRNSLVTLRASRRPDIDTSGDEYYPDSGRAELKAGRKRGPGPIGAAAGAVAAGEATVSASPSEKKASRNGASGDGGGQRNRGGGGIDQSDPLVKSWNSAKALNPSRDEFPMNRGSGRGRGNGARERNIG